MYNQFQTHQREKKTQSRISTTLERDFIRPYGFAHDQRSFDPSTLSRRLNNYNCEFYLRPQVGMSEFAETVMHNLQCIEENTDILDPKSIAAFVKK